MGRTRRLIRRFHKSARQGKAMDDNVLARFNGRYTIDGPQGHRTFQVRTAKGGNLKGERILSLLTGPDNTSDYEGFAFVKDDRIAVWGSKRGVGHFELYARMLTSLLKGEAELAQRGYKLLIEKRCRRCNRPLTHPQSIESGIGPECSGRGYKRKGE